MGFRQILLAIGLLLGAGMILGAEPPETSSGPELISVFPLGLQLGSSIEVEVKGKGLEEVYAVWFECHDVRASIKRIEKLKAKDVKKETADTAYEAGPTDPATYRVLLDVSVDANAELGLHGFRLVTPHGMSNGLPLQVVSEPVMVVGEAGHQRPENARHVTPPIVINGKIENKGELDFYAFDAAPNDVLLFRSFSNLKPVVGYRAKIELALHDPTGSWFNPARVNRINVRGPALSWEPMYALTRWFETRTFPTEFVLFPRLTHQFNKPGRYLISVGSFLGAGAPESFYLLKISADETSSRDSQPWFGRPAHRDPGDWLERDSSTLRQWGSFSRKIEPTRLQTLAARSVSQPDGANAKQVPTDIAKQSEVEPNDDPGEARTVTVPGIVAGNIGAPGDSDYFTFQVETGQKLAFEIETPRFAPPIFNPWLRVRNAADRVLFSNIYKEYGGDGDDVNKNLERKTLYTFQEGGTYSLEIRDLSLRDGGREFCYRVLIRPQVPHLGRVELNLDVISESSVLVDRADHVNLEAGYSKEIILVCEKEEGFDGNLAIGAENLPPGVELLSSTPAPRTESVMTGFQYRPPNRQVMPPDNYRAQRSPVTVVLYARPDAAVSTVPRMVRLTARPIVGRRAGSALPVMSFPLMVIAPQEQTSRGDER